MWDHLNDLPGPVNLDGDKKTGEHYVHRTSFGEVVMPAADYDELLERKRMLSDIALSAIALKMNIEHGLPPLLDALNRDLDAFQRRFGGLLK